MLILPKLLFDETKSVVIRLPFATRNEKFSKIFIDKSQIFTNGKVIFNITWNNRETQSLFNKKDKLKHLSCVIYKGVCSCGADCIGETTCTVNIRCNKHESGIDKNS